MKEDDRVIVIRFDPFQLVNAGAHGGNDVVGRHLRVHHELERRRRQRAVSREVDGERRIVVEPALPHVADDNAGVPDGGNHVSTPVIPP